MKSYTDLEQSKKLKKILPLESADMHYIIMGDDEDPQTMVGLGKYIGILPTIPAWSLTALLSVIPKQIKGLNNIRIDINEEDFSIWYDKTIYGVNTKLPDITMKCPVDACYEMILKLHELNLL